MKDINQFIKDGFMIQVIEVATKTDVTHSVLLEAMKLNEKNLFDQSTSPEFKAYKIKAYHDTIKTGLQIPVTKELPEVTPETTDRLTLNLPTNDTNPLISID